MAHIEVKLRCVGLAVCVMMTWTALAATDAFYDQRFKAGEAALLAKRHADAVEQLRIAAFGQLDDPKRLTHTLALMAIGQHALGRAENLESTINRFVDVESRFGAWDPSMLTPQRRSEFETLLIRVVPKETLLAVTSLARLIQPPARTAPATAASATAPATAPSNVAQAAARLVAEGRSRDAVPMLSEALTREPGRRDLRLLLLQAGALSSNWPVGVAQVAALRPFLDSEVVPMFYGAVSLFESGRLTEARELLKRALPRLTRSAYVDQYARRINSGRTGS